MKTVKTFIVKSLAIAAFATVCVAGFSSCNDEIIDSERDIIIEEDTIPLIVDIDTTIDSCFC